MHTNPIEELYALTIYARLTLVIFFNMDNLWETASENQKKEAIDARRKLSEYLFDEDKTQPAMPGEE